MVGTSPYGCQYGSPLMIGTAALSAASGIATAVTAPLTAKQQRMSAEAQAKAAMYQAQTQGYMTQAQAAQVAAQERGKTQRVMFGVGGIGLLALLGLAFFALK